MITLKELADKANKSFYKVVSHHFKNEPIFPLVVPSNKKINGTNFTDWKKDLVPLYEGSKELKGKGYKVDWKVKKINGSIQSVPAKIYFENLEDYLFFIRRAQDFKKIESARTLCLSQFPQLEEWTSNNPSLLLEYSDEWPDLLKVCSYFTSSSPPHDFYIRELPIEVHSKFIEQNAVILKCLLDLLLPMERVNAKEKDFASRYFLKKVSIYTQIRVLDDELKPYVGHDDISLTLDDAAWLKWTPQNVFIIENQTCYLTFPKLKNSVAIFGEGFKSRLTKHLPWLERANLYCWFDLDAAGFEMLNMVRQHYRNASSLLMDKRTYSVFEMFAVKNKAKKKELPYLSSAELETYKLIVEGSTRLEQERISQNYVRKHLINSGKF